MGKIKEIAQIHDDVFTFLQRWSDNSRGMSTMNPYFYMRTNQDDRFKKGYWFPGNDEYLCISFWSGGDSYNKTPNMYFEIHESKGCRVIFTSKDSQIKYKYFSDIADHMNEHPQRYKYVASKNASNWTKIFSRDYKDYLTALEDFMLNDKPRIDEYYLANPAVVEEEFISKFGFLDPKAFETTYSAVLKQRETILRKRQEEAQEFQQREKLPFALLKITIENYQGIRYTAAENLPPDAQWIFITGENGYGKTTVLQAIALGLNADPDLEKYIEDSRTRIRLEVVNKNEIAYPSRTKGGISVGHNETALDFSKYIVGYGPARLNVQAKDTENMDAKGSQNVKSLFDSTHTLKNINYELLATNSSDMDVFIELSDIVNLVTNGRIVRILVENREVYFTEQLSDGDDLDPQPLAKLAAGFRSIINMAFDIYFRFKSVQPGLKPSQFEGLVLIDEIENHLHPILQRELPVMLTRVFARLQFIVSTHSPIPLLGAPRNSVILKANRGKQPGVTIERLDQLVDFPNMLPNTILTSPIFGFEGIFSEARDPDKMIRVETTFLEMQKNDEQRIKIASLLTEANAKEILNLIKKP